MSCLYFLNIDPLLVIPFVNIFPYSTGCLFVLSMVSFAVYELLSLIRSNLSIFTCISSALGNQFRKKKNIARCFECFIGVNPLEKGMATHSSVLAWRSP